MLDVLVLIVTAGAVGASMWLAWRALEELVEGAREAAHGATDARRRLWAYRMRIFTLTGLAAVGLGVLAAARHDLAVGGALWLSGGMLAFGLLAWVSARASGRASRRNDKREHIRARLRFMRGQRRAADGAADRREREAHFRGSSQGRRRRTPRESEHQAKVRRALRTLGLPEDATEDDIKRAWREQVLRHHPDRHATDGDDAREEHAEAFRRAQRAYETLTEHPERT